MVSLHPKLPQFQGDKIEKHREHCRYCSGRPEWIFLLTRTQDYICESCFKQYDILLSNSRVDLPVNDQYYGQIQTGYTSTNSRRNRDYTEKV